MAKINITFDTVSKEMVVSLDGQLISDVEYVSCSCYGDDGKACLNLSQKPVKQDGMMIYKSVYAKEKEVNHIETTENPFSKSLASLIKGQTKK